MRTIALTGIILMQSLLLNAQAPGKITGAVLDSNARPVISATVLLSRADTVVVVKISVTDKDGKFQLENIKKGNYILSVTAIGYKKYVSPKIAVDTQNSIVGLPDIRLIQSGAALLQEASVVQKKPFIEEKIDRTVVNIGQLLSAAGSNMLDVLNKLPGVEANNNLVNLMGQGATVLINDKPTHLSGNDLANYLRSLPSSTIDRVELMINPPAKYDAAGSGGIINIVIKKVTDKGFTAGINTSYTQGVYAATNNSLNLNYHTNKINFSAIASYNYQNSYRDVDFSQYFLNPDGTINYQLNSSSNSTNPYHTGLLRLGLDYFLDKKTTIGVTLGGNIFGSRIPNNTYSNILDGKGVIDSTSLTSIAEKNKSHDESINLSLNHQYKKQGNELTINLDYIRHFFTADQLLNIYNFLPDGSLKDPPSYRIDSLPITLRVYSGKIDYAYPLKGKSSVQFGVKSSYVTTDNNGLYYNQYNSVKYPDLTLTNDFLYKENINAAYVNFNKDLKKFSFQAGLRTENTNISETQLGNAAVAGSHYKQNYINLFPTAFVMYRFDSTGKNQLVFSYGRRIDRPFYSQLNPFLVYVNKYSYTQGNPDLKPGYADNVRLAHTYKRFLTTALLFGYTSGLRTYVFRQVDSLTLIRRPENIASMLRYGGSVTATLHPTKWWNCTLTSQYLYFRWKGEGSNSNLDNSGGYFTADANNEFQLKQGWSAELTGNYGSKRVAGQYEFDGIWRVDAAIRKNILKNRGTLTLNVRDIFYSSNTSGRILDLNSSYAVFHNRADNRTIGLNFAYRFGKQYQNKRKETSSEDEEKRMVN